MKKVLIITYYWPPSGGAGVQRWVKLTKYLADLDTEIHVLTVDEKYASYSVLDCSLNDDISNKLFVYKTKSFEPINLYGKFFGKENIPTAGFSNIDNSKLKQKVINFLRSNFFIPDPRRGWNYFAYKKACQIIKKYNIQYLITTSPPHSTQLLGLKLKKKYNLNWMADLRDPWTDIYYYKILNHSWISRIIDAWYEKKVLINADKIIIVSSGVKKLFTEKIKTLDSTKFNIIPNGFDPDDFKKVSLNRNLNLFTITYTGTMSSAYNPQVIFDVLEEMLNEKKIHDFTFNFIGNISDDIVNYYSKLLINKYIHCIPSVSHNKVVEFQKQSDILFLVIPDIEKSEGILTGKLFEYLATGNKILGLGPKNGDASYIINFTESGKLFDRSEKQEIKQFLINSFENFKNRILHKNTNEKINVFNRKNQSQNIYDLLC